MSADVLALPKVLLMGLRKSGKSSIQKVVFEGMQPHDSVNLPTTVQPDKTTVHSNDFVNFEVWDFPGQNDPFDRHGHFQGSMLFENCGAIVYVLDCRELIEDARARLLDTICAAYCHNPELCVEVFIHKVDALSEDHQSDLLSSLQRRVVEECKQRLDVTTPLALHFNLTSIYDYSVFQAFSVVVQKLIRHKINYITELLQMLNTNSNLELSYLFLSRSKIFLAVDLRNRLNTRTYDLCSDAIEVVVKMNRIYATRQMSVPASTPKESFDELIGKASLDRAVEGGRTPLGEGTSAVIQLSDENCIYVRELPSSLTVVAMMKQENLESKVLIDRNVDTFYRAVFQVFSSATQSGSGAQK